MRTLFLQAPSYDGFDGGAGARYQAKREIKSFWFPTWLAQDFYWEQCHFFSSSFRASWRI